MGWNYRMSSKWNSVIKLQSHVFSDENSVVKFSKHSLIQQIDYRPRPELSISPGVGAAYEEVKSFQDQGWVAQVSLNARNLEVMEYTNNLNGFSRLFFFPGRRNQEHRYYVSWFKQFSSYASDSLRVGYEFVDNTYHLAQGTEFENVQVNARFLSHQLDYRISGRTQFRMENKFQNRDVTQSNPGLHNHRKELNLANRFELLFNGERFSSALTLFTSQTINEASRRSGDLRESRTDIEGLQTALNYRMNWRLSSRDQWRFSMAYTKYAYSSPDTTLDVDEDDLRLIADFAWLHRFSSYFKVKLWANLYLYHQIYLKASRSANNNWNRIYQLGPSFYLNIPGVLENSVQIRILANYTVYDFEDLLPAVQSYIHRKLIFTDSLRLNLTAGLQLLAMYQLEKEDNGTFYKKIFAQQLTRELTSHFIDLSLVYRRFRRFRIISGLNWFIRDEWSYLPRKQRTRQYFSFSPRLICIYSVEKNLLLRISFAPKVYRDLNLPRQYYGTGQVNLQYFF